MNEAEVICTLLIVVAALAILAKKAALPYPVLLTERRKNSGSSQSLASLLRL